MQACTILALVVAAASGCSLEVDYGGTRFRCDTSSDCPGGEECNGGYCGGAAVPPEPGEPDEDVGDGDGDDGSGTLGSDEEGKVIVSFGDNADDDVHGAVSDTYSNAAVPANNYGNAVYMMSDASPAKVSLLRIDVAAIPSGATVLAAELVLWTDDNPLEQGSIVVEPVAEAWSEGDRNASAGESNFDLRLPGVAWTQAGVGPASREDEQVAEFVPDVLDTRYVVPLPATLVQEWHDEPDDNFGLALLASSVELGCHFHTRESATDGRRPRLVVTYQP